MRSLIEQKIKYHQTKFAQLKTGSYHRGAIDALKWVLKKLKDREV